MSRTDVHRPGWVKERDYFMRHLFVEHHDHRHGPCDLELWQADPNADTSCGMRYQALRNIYCGCRLCTGHHERRADRRRERHAGKAEIRRALRILEPRR